MLKEKIKELKEYMSPKGLVINFTRDYTPSIEELHQLSLEIKKLQQRFQFIRDWDLIKQEVDYYVERKNQYDEEDV